jgi:hypothetical protein
MNDSSQSPTAFRWASFESVCRAFTGNFKNGKTGRMKRIDRISAAGTSVQRARPLGLLLAGSMFLFSCSRSGPEVGRVEGVVTLDGAPLPEAIVYFRHEDGGRNAQAMTDQDGRFILNFNSSEAGAIVGVNTVRITTFVESNFDDAGRLIPGTGKPELVPERYNRQSDVKVTVEPGDNQFEFDVQTAGSSTT